MAKTTDIAKTVVEQVEELLPQEGGSYTRQPDGSLVRSPEPAQAQDTPVDSTTTETTPVQE